MVVAQLNGRFQGRENLDHFVMTMRNQFLRLIMLENALCDDATSSTQGSEWYSHFKNRQTSIMDFEQSGQPLLSQTEKWG